MRLAPLTFAALLSPTLAAPAAPSADTGQPCLEGRWASTLAPGSQAMAPRGAWPHAKGRVLGFAFAPTPAPPSETPVAPAPRDKLFLFLLDNGACFTRAVMIDHSGGQATTHLFDPDSRRKLSTLDTPPDLATATRIAAEALR